jgi:hypothetical protein
MGGYPDLYNHLFSVKTRMTLTEQAKANVAAIESKLAEHDELFREFCSRYHYSFSSVVGVWPRRRAWRRQEIDRCFDLTMDVGVQEVLDRGFYPALPWSLHATGSLNSGHDPYVPFLSRPVFEHVPFSRLGAVIPDGLQRGLAILDALTEHAIVRKGRKFGRSAEPGASPSGGPATRLGNSAVTEGPPSVS